MAEEDLRAREPCRALRDQRGHRDGTSCAQRAPGAWTCMK
jgi:hypothetical protein